jgi:RNA polymerase sigma-70 factor (ECF subfamily)
MTRPRSPYWGPPDRAGNRELLRDTGIVALYTRPQSKGSGDEAVTSVTNVSELDPLEELLTAAGRGDRQAFTRLYNLSASRLLPIALRILRQREPAEEVLQEAYLTIWKKAGQYHPDRGRPLAWMATIVRNRAIDTLRSQNREPRSAASLDDLIEAGLGEELAADAPYDHIDSSLRGCLEKLQTKQQKAIVLAFYYGHTHEELASKLESPLGTVKSWVRRGLLELRECLDQ